MDYKIKEGIKMKIPKLRVSKKTKPTELCYILNCDDFEYSECIIDQKVKSFKLLVELDDNRVVVIQ